MPLLNGSLRYAVFLLLSVPLSLTAQSVPIAQQVYEAYSQYQESAILTRRFRQSDLEPLLLSWRKHPGFSVKKVGQSVEGRAIYDVSFGTGKTQVLLWSQMHGNESTATMAGLDLFNFMAEDDSLNDLRQTILDNLTVHFVPMLNPDGAETFQRRNAFDIDLNRDALRLQSPESRLLKHLRDSLEADFGFNLHDQSIHYTAGKTSKPATISFLAPPYNVEKEMNPVRTRATQLIVLLNQALQQYIPGQVGRYDDTFEPRAFGDNMQRWSTSTILIESGGYPNDPEKQLIRRLNFMLLVTGLHAIATQRYASVPVEEYQSIPKNERQLYDLVVRNVQREKNGKRYTLDVGINRTEVTVDSTMQFFYRSRIQELGDMSVYYGYQELDAAGMVAVPGKVWKHTKKNLKAVSRLNAKRLMKRGFTTVRVKDLETEQAARRYVPLDVVPEEYEPDYALLLGNPANFMLEQDGKIRYAIVNGFVFEL